MVAPCGGFLLLIWLSFQLKQMPPELGQCYFAGWARRLRNTIPTFAVVLFINLAILHLRVVENRSASIEMRRGSVMMSTTPVDLQIPRKAKSAVLCKEQRSSLRVI